MNAKKREWVVVLCMALVLTQQLGCRRQTQTFVMSTNSMSPAIRAGSSLIANPDAYTSVDDVKRWDVIVLRRYALRRPSAPVAKRVVGLSGEIISIAGTNIYIDGNMLVVPGNLVLNLSDFTGDGFTFLERERRSYTIPQDCLFVVGDNLRHSRDSRMDGAVSFADVIGKVIQILPVDD